MKKLAVVFSLFSLLLFFGNEAEAQIVVKVKPARPAHILVKPANAKTGHVWVNGHWKWNITERKYNWAKGHWVKVKAGHNWVPGKWVVANGGHKWVPGSWKAAKVKQAHKVHHKHTHGAHHKAEKRHQRNKAAGS